MKKLCVAFAALAALGVAETTLAQSTNLRDDTELLISQIQTDKRAIVLATMQLTDTEVRAFTPVYDKYQADMKQQYNAATELLNKFAANFGSMTDDAAKDLMKDWFELRDDRNATLKKYAREMGRDLPATKVLQWVQIENKLNAVIDLQAASVIPIAR